jgi:hypothetical protein
MAEPVTSHEDITPVWVTARLLENGHLNCGEVSGINRECFSTHFSHICRLCLTYSEDAAPALPSRMLLKSALPEIEGSLNMGRVEVSVYTSTARAMVDPPLARCFDAVYSTQSNRSHILIEDLSPTHFQPEIPIPPSRRHCELSVQSLAQFHAFGWGNRELGLTVGELLDLATVKKIVAELETGIAGMAGYLGDALSAERRAVYERALASMTEFWSGRLTSTRGNTLIHGDAHLWNFLHPRDADNGRAYLIDLGTTNRIRPPTNDLAYMMALQWYPERRAAMELDLLKCYHDHLISLGVTDYPWEDCLLDYRFSIIAHLFTPVFQWAGKRVPATVWWHNLDRIFEAYQDLNCDELI